MLSPAISGIKEKTRRNLIDRELSALVVICSSKNKSRRPVPEIVSQHRASTKLPSFGVACGAESLKSASTSLHSTAQRGASGQSP